jgi:hypothetical protein
MSGFLNKSCINRKVKEIGKILEVTKELCFEISVTGLNRSKIGNGEKLCS